MQVIQYRRALHRIPELDRDLPETLSYLRGILSPLSCTLSSPIPGALCAIVILTDISFAELNRLKHLP